MRLHTLVLSLTMLVVGPVWADEHAACQNIDYPYGTSNATELRGIAATCQSPPVATLYYKRAYHLDLVDEAETLSILNRTTGRESTPGFLAYRLYIQLIEALSQHWLPDPAQRVAFLNREYEHRGEVASLRLRGHHHLANALEETIFRF